MKKKDIYTLTNFTIEEVNNLYNQYELELLLWIEPDIVIVDVMLENMEVYFVEKELYEKACVVRDEIKRRIDRSKSRKPLK